MGLYCCYKCFIIIIRRTEMRPKLNQFINKINVLWLVAIIQFSSQIGAKVKDKEREVELIMNQLDKPVIPELSNRLIHMANDEDLNGEYYNSIKHYRQSY